MVDAEDKIAVKNEMLLGNSHGVSSPLFGAEPPVNKQGHAT